MWRRRPLCDTIDRKPNGHRKLKSTAGSPSFSSAPSHEDIGVTALRKNAFEAREKRRMLKTSEKAIHKADGLNCESVHDFQSLCVCPFIRPPKNSSKEATSHQN